MSIIFYSLIQNGQIDFHVDQWELSNFDRNKVISKSGKKIKVVEYTKKDKLKDKILENNSKKILELQYNINYKKPENSGININFKKSKKKII